jgi:hypothetical protein
MRRSVAAIGLVLTACGGAPTTPSPASPVEPAIAQFAGLWSASYKVAFCSGERHCVLTVGTTRTFSLRLQQSGSHVEGLFVVGLSVADMSGDVQKDGHLTLKGIDQAVTSQDTSMTAQLELQLGPAGVLTGTVLHETTVPPGYDVNVFGPVRITGDVVSSVRSDLASFALAIDGVWSGNFAVRSCTPVLPDPYCYPYRAEEISSIQLALQRAGSGLSGTITIGSGSIPVSGTIAGTSFTMHGETVSPASGGNSLLRVNGFTGAIDGFGRMTGTLLYESAYPVAAPRIGESAQLELRQVLKQP